MYESIRQAIELAENSPGDVKGVFLERLRKGNLTRDDGDMTHFCVYFLPYNKIDNKVLIVHHKKSDLWLSPGGHIDQNEMVLDALSREIKEELGSVYTPQRSEAPFLLTVTPINNDVQPCKVHYDFWYLFKTDGIEFNIDPREFHETRWLTITEAQEIVTDKANKLALSVLENNTFY